MAAGEHWGYTAQQTGNLGLTASFIFHFSSLIGVLPLGQLLLMLYLYLADRPLALFSGIPLEKALMGDGGCISQSLTFIYLQKKQHLLYFCRCLSLNSPLPPILG